MEIYKNIYTYIYRYIYEILIKFTNPFSFNVLGYFSSVYTKNLDVWGFVMTYVTVCESAINKEYTVYNDIVKNNMKSLNLAARVLLSLGIAVAGCNGNSNQMPSETRQIYSNINHLPSQEQKEYLSRFTKPEDYETILKRSPWINPEKLTNQDKIYLQEEKDLLGAIIQTLP